MRLLLDTHVVLAAGAASNRLSPRVAELLTDDGNTLFLSSISVWEIVTKYGLGKLPLAAPPAEWLSRVSDDLELAALPFKREHALCALELPLLHRDPFDRMLVSQATVEGLCLLTADAMIRQYNVPTIW